MNRAIFIAIVSMAIAAHSTITAVVVSETCEHITRRTYFISRLERTMAALKNFNPSHSRIVINSELFKHPEVITTASLINEQNTLEPLFQLWQKLKEYKKVDDFLLMQEFTKLILFLPSHIQPIRTIIEQSRADIRLSLEGTSYIEAVTLRHYYSERLKRAVAFLKLIPCAQKDFFETAQPGCDCAFITNYQFNHPEIAKIIQEMADENNLGPISRLAHEFSSLKLINDAEFQKEFMILIFTTYRNLVINNANRYHYPINKNTLQTIAHLYDNVERIPLEQILDAIDLLAEELPIILQKYEFNSKMEWKEWLKKYWWMTALAFSSVGYRVLRIFYPSKPKS